MNIFRILLLMLVTLSGIQPLSLHAEAAPCAGRNNPTPIANGPTGRELAGGYAHGLLWKIERPGVAPSYLFGTIHLEDPRVTTLPSAVMRPFSQAHSYIGETILDPQAVAYYTQHMYFADAKTLQDFLDKPLFDKTIELLVEHGIPRGAAERLKPWAAFTILSRPKQAGDQTMDVFLQDMAERLKLPVYGLESMQELVTTLSDIPMKDQVEILTDTVCNQELIEKQTVELTERYLDHDLAGLMAINYQFEPHDKAVFDAFMNRILVERSKRMLERMLPRLAEGNAFIAVGALHLPGEKGLLHLLETRGFQVTSVY